MLKTADLGKNLFNGRCTSESSRWSKCDEPNIDQVSFTISHTTRETSINLWYHIKANFRQIISGVFQFTIWTKREKVDFEK